MATILELAQQIVMAHASTTQMSSKEMLQVIQEVHALLQSLEKGETQPVSTTEQAKEETPAISLRKAFGKNTVTCLLCGKQMKTLARHLGSEHGTKPAEYRKQFNIPRTQPLAAKAYSESRRQMAQERDLGANLAKARAARGKAKKAAPTKETPKKASTRTRAPRKSKAEATE